MLRGDAALTRMLSAVPQLRGTRTKLGLRQDALSLSCTNLHPRLPASYAPLRPWPQPAFGSLTPAQPHTNLSINAYALKRLVSPILICTWAYPTA